MKQPANIKQIASLEPDFMGFIFYKGSKRYAGTLMPEELDQLPENIKRVGVFVDEDIDEVLAIVMRYNLNGLQLHGAESVAYCMELKNKLNSAVFIIKAFGINEAFEFNGLDSYVDAVDYFLFDTQTPAHGGSGKQFDWSLLDNYKLQTPYFLSGGIGIEQVEAIQVISDERLYALDVNSRFETEPGVKDYDKLKNFKIRL
ncbi:MAG: phosphoribosylanthranilate isomerase [Bacteroidota bacterium]